ncbi:unnamed protein product [Lota lota]
MADTAVETTAPTTEVTAKELKEKKEVEVEDDKKENGSGDAPANGTNGADHSEKAAKEVAEEKHENGNGKAEETPPAEKAEAQPVKRSAEEEENEEEEEKVETKKQKTEENGDSKAEVEA